MRIFTVRNSSCGKAMFLHLSVILFTVGGGVHGGRAFVAGWPVWQGACVAGGVHVRGCAWQGGACMMGAHVCVAGETATAAAAPHPTGMHSCFN